MYRFLATAFATCLLVSPLSAWATTYQLTLESDDARFVSLWDYEALPTIRNFEGDGFEDTAIALAATYQGPETNGAEVAVDASLSPTNPAFPTYLGSDLPNGEYLFIIMDYFGPNPDNNIYDFWSTAKFEFDRLLETPELIAFDYDYGTEVAGYSFTVAAVPLPMSGLMLSGGLILLGAARRRSLGNRH